MATHEDVVRRNIQRQRARNDVDPSLIAHYERHVLPPPGDPLAARTIAERFKAADQAALPASGVLRGPMTNVLLGTPLVRVMTVESVDRWHAQGRLGKWTPDELADRLSARSAELPELSGSMNGHRGLIWLARAADLEGAIGGAASRADAARDVLGLIHFIAGSRLIYLLLKSRLLGRAYVPSFIDGGAHEVFYLYDQPTPWSHGYTCALSGCERGLAEVVGQGGVSRVELGVEIRQLGIVLEHGQYDFDRLLSH